MAAITFCDLVVSREPFSDGLLLHELVHVEQYRQLGIQRFSELYVRGFFDGRSYDAIPLEVNAYTRTAQTRAAVQGRRSVGKSNSGSTLDGSDFTGRNCTPVIRALLKRKSRPRAQSEFHRRRRV